MNIFKKIKQTIYGACLYFTVAEFILLIIATIINRTVDDARSAGEIVSDGVVSAGGLAGRFLGLNETALVFLTCLIMSALRYVRTLDYSRSVKVLIHYIGSLIAFTPLFFIAVKNADAARMIFFFIAFTVIYAVICFIAMLISSIRKNRRTEDLEYESRFGGF